MLGFVFLNKPIQIFIYVIEETINLVRWPIAPETKCGVPAFVIIYKYNHLKTRWEGLVKHLQACAVLMCQCHASAVPVAVPAVPRRVAGDAAIRAGYGVIQLGFSQENDIDVIFQNKIMCQVAYICMKPSNIG